MSKRYAILLICGALVAGIGHFVYRIVGEIPDQKFCGSAARIVAAFLAAHDQRFPSRWADFIVRDNARGASWSEAYLRKIGDLPWGRSVYDLTSTKEVAAKTTTAEEHMRRYFNSVFASSYEVQCLPSRPNKSLQPTATAVTPPAAQEIVPSVAVAEH
jgi:hypothetical protein